MDIKQVLKGKLRGIVPNGLLDKLPSRYPVIGGAVLLRLKPELLPYGKQIGEALLDILQARSVWTFTGPAYGIERRVKVIHLAGDPNPVVVHRELNTLFKLDIYRLTFSPGNSGERAKLLKIIKPDDVVLDFFCCCGNLSMPVAVNVKPKRVIGLEINPLAFRYLLETIKLNRVSHIFRALNIDNHYWDFQEEATHVLLGFLPKPDRIQTEKAFMSLAEEGTVHYHVAVRKENLADEVNFLRRLATKVGFEILEISVERVKEVAPRIIHNVLRVRVRRRG